MSTFLPLNTSVLRLPALTTSSFSVPTTPASSSSAKIPLAPQFTAGPTGMDPYRSLRHFVVDGEFYVANGFDQPRRWNRSAGTWAYLGSAAPADFGLALSAAGSPAAIPNGVTARYYVVGVNTTLDKETAPQGGADLAIANSSGGTRDVTVTWTPGSLPAEFDSRRIYRALNQTDDYKRIATVADATGAYLDVTPDASLLSQAAILAWDGAVRTTLPPAFADCIEDGGRIWAFERAGDWVSYSRQIRPLGTAVVEDFRAGDIVQIGADDGTGAPTALVPYQGALVIFKATSGYMKTGDVPPDCTVSRFCPDRGAFNRNTVVPLTRGLFVLDMKGPYRVTPGMYAEGGGVVEETWRQSCQPLVDRFNLGAADRFHAVHLARESVVIFWVALDFDPVPQHGLVFDYVRDLFLGVVTARRQTAAGILRGADGSLHPCFGNDLGFVYEDLNGESEGVYAGDNVATLTAGSDTTRVLTASGAAFSTSATLGPIGTPLDRYNSAGTVVDENWVYAGTGTTVTTYLYPSAAYASGDSIAVGVIPGVMETMMFQFETPELKDVRDVVLEFASGVSGSIRIDMKLDDGSWIRKGEQSLATLIRSIIPVANTTNRNDGQCWRFQFRISQRYANLGFSIRSVAIPFVVIPERRK